jgi:hypothetical protein
MWSEVSGSTGYRAGPDLKTGNRLGPGPRVSAAVGVRHA